MHWIFDYITNSWVEWSLVILYWTTIIATIAVVVSENRNPVKSLAWVTVLLVVPMIGIVLYVVFGRNIQNKRIISRRNRRKLRRMGTPASASGSAQVAESTVSNIKLANSLGASPVYTGNALNIYDTGCDKFEALLEDIARAKQYIHIQYYIVADDHIGSRVMEALCERARAGVRVRMIYDHVGSFKLSRRSLRRLREAGVEVYPFFTVTFPTFGTRINWRNHRKIAIIDGEVGYIGGMNVADRYIDGGRLFSLWRDLHLRVKGPAVAALECSFAIDWHFMGHSLLDEKVESAPVEGSDIGIQLLTGGPTTQWMNITMMFQHLISTARKCVYVLTPYFIPTEGLLQALQIAALSRVDVRLLLPRRSDSDMLRWASSSYVRECLQAGIKVYFYEPGMLHSKAVIIDDDICSVGSANFDCRSFEHNFEANMLIYSRDFNARLKERFYAYLRESTRIQPREWASRPLPEKALESFMRLFSPIL